MNRQAKTRALRDDVLSQVAADARRDQLDTRYNWLRVRSRRRQVVAITGMSLASLLIGHLLDQPWINLFALLAYMACLWLLRTAVRGMTHYPDELVDERILAARGKTYRLAYMGAMALMVVYLVSYIGNQLIAKLGWITPLSAEALHDYAFVCFFAALALPDAIHAWREPEEP
jgi:hypothetical protein